MSPVANEQLNGNPAGTAVKELLDSQQYVADKKGYWVLRRAQDVFFSAIALVVLSPILLVTALAVVIDDPKGGPIFSQDRVGKDGKIFRLHKFRSMCVDAEAKLELLMDQNEADGPAFKIKDDPRITHVGKFIRKTSIDELPQLWNILKGDMSIVGPRPPLPREVEQYDAYQRQRLMVTPGLTCFWQIQKNRNDLSFDEWMDLDIKYIKERGFWTDWKLIFGTVGAVFGGRGR